MEDYNPLKDLPQNRDSRAQWDGPFLVTLDGIRNLLAKFQLYIFCCVKPYFLYTRLLY